MIDYIMKKLLRYVISFIIILIVIFSLPRMMPGNPKDYYLITTVHIGETHEKLQSELIARLGLNKSITDQFIMFLVNTFQGYFGLSWRYYPREVSSIIIERLPWTFFLVLSARIISFMLGYLLGVIAAWKHGSKIDILIQLAGLVSMNIPPFWVGLVLLLIFAFYIPVLPFGGSLTPGFQFRSFWDFACDFLYHAILPITTLSIVTFFMDALIMRNNMIEILGEDFITTAEAKGLKNRTIMFKHAARNALLPFVTGAFMGFGLQITGAIFVETVFAYPGMGMLLNEAILSRDFPLIQGILITTTIIILTSNFIADLLYARLDPRIRLKT
ncbi:MAG: ABC transporter permease [Candidatus Bathyarchaeia archaeon]